MAKQAYVYSGTDWVPLASEVTNLSGYQTKALNQFAHRNLIINGDMQIAQRSSSVASITAGGYNTADRWRTLLNTQGTWTQSVENDAPTGSGFRKSLKMLCTTADASPAAGDYVAIDSLFEGQNLQHIKKGTSAAEQLTVSFWVKSNVTGTYIFNISDQDNNRQVSKSYTINASGTWEYKTITFPADTTGALDNDNARSLDIRFYLGAGTDSTSGTLQTTWSSYTAANSAVGQVNLASAISNYWQVTGVQLEVGDTATPFEFKPFAQDLAECQRYFQRMGYDNESYTFYSVGSVQTTTNSIFIIPLITQMRTAPVVTFINPTNLVINDSTNNVSVSSASCIRPTVFNLGEVSVNVTGGTHTIGRGCRLLSNNQTNTQIQSSAEL
jgi:hypothetical protein